MLLGNEEGNDKQGGQGEEEGKDLRDRIGKLWHKVLDEVHGSQLYGASRIDKIVL